MNLAPATSTDVKPARVGNDVTADGITAAWLCGVLQTSDSYFPTGSYAHSFGLEALVQEGVVHDRATLRTFLLTSALPALTRAELPLVCHAWVALAGRDWDQLGEVSFLASALRTAREARIASENIGRQRAELASTLQPASIASDYTREAAARGWPFSSPVSAALEAQVCGAPLVAALSSYSYSAIAALLAAAMKLLRLGQISAQTLLTEVLSHVPDAITAAQQVGFDEIGWSNPWLDIAGARHESADARMFIS